MHTREKCPHSFHDNSRCNPLLPKYSFTQQFKPASMDAIKILRIILLAFGCVAYVYGIAKAFVISWKGDDVNKMPAFLVNVVGTIGTILATNLGAVMGLTLAESPSDSFSEEDWDPVNLFVAEHASKAFQTTACYIYVIGLIAAAIVWTHRKFETDPQKIVPLVPELTKSLLGVIVGVLVVALGISQ